MSSQKGHSPLSPQNRYNQKIISLAKSRNKKISEYLHEYLMDRADLSDKTIEMDKTAVRCFIKERNVPVVKEALLAMGKRKPAGAIFWNVRPDAYTKTFKRYARALNIRGVHFHTLRHSAATEMLAKGIPLSVI